MRTDTHTHTHTHRLDRRKTKQYKLDYTNLSSDYAVITFCMLETAPDSQSVILSEEKKRAEIGRASCRERV